ncbi:glycerol kinase GlpK [Hellea balneolensis]|uniref:glycerol kinase GlpK n=1 Tax=Hellea balneolensis TaxID=287478 RepID=UPI000403B283|nr:glycerol kinase GlpK [Hellea balneolensis]
MTNVILSIDQGTTSSRTLVFSPQGDVLFTAQEEFPQIYPADGWVEHDPEAIWETTLKTLRKAYRYARDEKAEIVGLGITNQRETALVWERKTGKAIYNAIVWQDRRTAETCRDIKANYNEADLTAKTGLLLDPYFSATKAAWILDHVEGARTRAKNGELAFGTVDSFLIWRLTGGKTHATDATNASRTNLFNIHRQDWDQDLLRLFNVPASVLPEVKDCADNYGAIDGDILGEPIPILGVAGDQQAAAIGQSCFAKGDIKSTYGTGCFVILNTGDECITSRNRLLSTVCYRLNGKTTYALEGSIFIAGAAVQWLRDGIQIIKDAAETEAMCEGLESNKGVYLVPAFTGLGAPHWDPDARGAIFGLTRDTGRAEIARATVESVCYQTYDLFKAMSDDGVTPTSLRVDGGMVYNSWMVQHLAGVLDIPVDRPKVLETTALGAAYLAGLQAGLYSSLEDVKANWQRDKHFKPAIEASKRQTLLKGWDSAVKKVLT